MHKTKRPLSLLLAVVMVLSVFGGISFNASAAGIMSETIDTTQGPWEESYDFDGNDVRIFAMEGGGYGDGHGFHLYGDTFYANIKARNAQRPITITGAEVTSGEYPISWLRPLKGTMTVDGDTAIISDVYSSTLRLESESNLRIKEVKVYYYYAVSGVTLNETYAAMNIGDTKTLTATVAPDDAMYKNVTWASANPDIATVSDTGVVTAVAPGRVNITATADNGTADTSDDKTATCSVRVLGEVETTLSYLVWDDASKTLVEKTGDEACANYELITADTTALEDGKWYAIDDDTTVSGRITVNGTAHLILRDDLILTVPKGITTTGATLNIYGQRAGTGELYAGRQQDGYTTVPRDTACIGGVGNADGGTVIIHGGKITVSGGSGAAGIGGAYKGAGGTVTVYGGTITAAGGSSAAGIGGGYQGAGGTVTVYGGTITAAGGRQGAGIGGGATGTGGEVTIYGGTVTATGGGDGAGIGGGYRGAGGKVVIYGGTVVANGAQDGSTGGAGIGGGTRGAGGEVIMNGGDVTATGTLGAGIGGGTYGAGGTVTITGGTVKAYSKGTTSSFGAAIGAGSGNSEQGTLTLAENMIVKAETVALADKEWEDLQEVSREEYMNNHTQRRAYLVTPVVAVTGVTLDQEAVTLTVGETASLSATVAPEDATDNTVVWESDNTAVAMVDEYGTVTAVASGTANITVTTTDGGFTASCAVTVNVPTYTVTWLNDDGSLIDTTTVAYGETPTHADATKTATAQYTYTFAGWDKEIVAVTGDATYTATFNATVNSYTITWLNDDGTEIDTTTVAYGETPTHADATKTATAQYTYTFAGWDKEIVAVTGDATYTATFNATVNSYTITWKNDDGSVIDTTTVPYGTVPTHADATKTATAQYTYTFAGWDKEIVAVTGDATYTATFDATVNAYTIQWLNEDGDVLKTESVNYGVVPTYTGETPTKAEDHAYTYTFAGWDKEIAAVTGDETYTATFTKTEKTEQKDWMSVRIDDQIYIKYLLHNRENLERVTVEYLDQDGVEAVQTKVYTADQLTFDGNDMFEILAVIAPAQIGDMVKVTILANGQPTEYEYSVAKYCEYLIDGAYEENVKTLAKATLEYGKAANDYFYGTGFYHQSTITSPYSVEYKEEALHRAQHLTNTLSADGEIRSMLASASFMALTKPEFRFYTTGLTEEEAYELNSKITTNVNGVTAKFYKNGDAILLEVKGIKAEDMDKVITITVGDLGTITFSGNDFARMMANNNDQSVATLGAALYLYGEAAKACFA